jgi:protein ImuB
MRLACVFVPQLALQSVLRRTPEARETATALIQGTKSRRVIAVTDGARRAGVRCGMTVAQASAACPALRLLTASAADVDAAAAALADVGYGFAPRIETERGRIFFDVSDLHNLYPLGETAIAQAIQAQAARVGLGVRVSIASGKGTARIATRARELAVVAPGGERVFLAPLPVRVLEEGTDDDGAAAATAAIGRPSPLLTTLHRWGVSRVGALAALPVADVALRLGDAGARLCRLAAGVDGEPFFPHLPTDALEEGMELDYPIYEIEPLSFVLRGLIDRALMRLGCRSLACAGLTLRLALDPRGLDVREIVIAAPTREAGTLLQLARLDLARRPPAAAVVGVTLIALPARVRPTQLDILRPSGPAPDRLAATIARLAALVGPGNVGSPRAEDCWREEAIAVTAFLPPSSALAPPTGGPSLTVRRFRPPQEIEVLMGRSGPAALRGRETTARVLVAAGPYRMNGEWWRSFEDDQTRNDGDGWSRDFWDVHASDGAVYRLHQDHRNGKWYLDGYYD